MIKQMTWSKFGV